MGARMTAPHPDAAFPTWTSAVEAPSRAQEDMVDFVRARHRARPVNQLLAAAEVQALLQTIAYLEAQRDRDGDFAVALRAKHRREREHMFPLQEHEQLFTLLKRVAPLVAWASRTLQCDRNLSAVLAAIEVAP